MAEQLSVDIRTYSTVTGIDTGARELVLGDERLAYSKLVLAWGADVIRLGLDGDGLDRVYSINDLLDYRAFRKALEGGKRRSEERRVGKECRSGWEGEQ